MNSLPRILLLLLILVARQAHAQTSLIDSLKAVADNEALSDTDRLLAKGLWAYEVRSDVSDENLQFIESIVAEAEALGSVQGQARALAALGALQWRLGTLDLAGETLLRAEALALQAQDSITLIRAKIDRGTVYYFDDDFEHTLDQLGQAAQLCFQMKNSAMLHVIYNNMASTYRKLRNFQEAGKYYDMALRIAYEIQDKYWIGFYTLNLGQTALYEDNDQEALTYFGQGKAVLDSLDNDWLWAKAIMGEGIALTGLHQAEQAIPLLEQGFAYPYDYNLLDMVIMAKVAMGEAYRQQGQYEQALDYGKAGVAEAKSYEPFFYQHALLALNETYTEMGEDALALEVMHTYETFTDSLARLETQESASPQVSRSTPLLLPWLLGAALFVSLVWFGWRLGPKSRKSQ